MQPVQRLQQAARVHGRQVARACIPAQAQSKSAHECLLLARTQVSRELGEEWRSATTRIIEKSLNSDKQV